MKGIGQLLDAAAGLITGLGFVYFLIAQLGPKHGGRPIFGDLAGRLLPSEQMRGAFLIVWIGSMIWLMSRGTKAFRG
jgi:hypothetical protein